MMRTLTSDVQGSLLVSVFHFRLADCTLVLYPLLISNEIFWHLLLHLLFHLLMFVHLTSYLFYNYWFYKSLAPKGNDK